LLNLTSIFIIAVLITVQFVYSAEAGVVLLDITQQDLIFVS